MNCHPALGGICAPRLDQVKERRPRLLQDSLSWEVVPLAGTHLPPSYSPCPLLAALSRCDSTSATPNPTRTGVRSKQKFISLSPSAAVKTVSVWMGTAGNFTRVHCVPSTLLRAVGHAMVKSMQTTCARHAQPSLHVRGRWAQKTMSRNTGGHFPTHCPCGEVCSPFAYTSCTCSVHFRSSAHFWYFISLSITIFPWSFPQTVIRSVSEGLIHTQL